MTDQTEDDNVRSYAEKSKAKRGLKVFTKLEGAALDDAAHALVYQCGERWCFEEDQALKYVRDLEAGANHTGAASQEDPQPGECDLPMEETVQQQEALSNGDQPVPGAGFTTSDDAQGPQDADHIAGAGVFGAMNHTLQNVPQAPTASAPQQRNSARGAYKIEKNRPEQNGIKRPSVGGLCRQVWDAMDALREAQEGVVPTSQQARALAAERGWNLNNAMIEFYQWRKYNGITGRAPKAATQQQPQQEQQA
jgi:hypothetical protein